MKILNLYAGIGGNRMYWGNGHDITAVEFNQSIADCYKDLYPNDKVIVEDAHDYLLEHYYEFDFIWTSPPCQSHSKARQCGASVYYYNDTSYIKGCKPIYPDMKLWQEIIFLQHHAKCNWVAENVVPYYKPFISPSFTIGRHHFWSNRFIIDSNLSGFGCHDGDCKKLQQVKKIDLSKYKFTGINKRQVLRNMTEPDVGLYVFQQLTGD